MGTKVLVAGGAGFIGSTTAHHLRRAGYSPIVLDDFSRGHRCFVSDFKTFEADIADVGAVQRILEEERIEAVLHFAARIEIGESVRAPLKYYETNVSGTVSLLSAMERAEVSRLVFSSSAAVYGEPTKTPIPEDHPVAPVNPYGHTKAMMEQIIADWGDAPSIGAQPRPSWIALRYFNAAGADTSLFCGEWHQPETHLIPNALRAAAGLTPELSLFGTDHPTPDGTAVRDYIHVADLAAAHVAAVERLFVSEQSVNRAFNLGTGKGCSVRAVIDTASAVTGKPVRYSEQPIRAGDPPALVAAAAAAQTELGWTPKRSDLETIVGDAWTWFNEHGFTPPA
ncbi:MAG: UDP-glucose 4-epimerase GalE [Proteobacteria bacterium]|nr:MAG: UDP-glucose 4-epimerase GalE [Pseudomonadota bacterium]